MERGTVVFRCVSSIRVLNPDPDLNILITATHVLITITNSLPHIRLTVNSPFPAVLHNLSQYDYSESYFLGRSTVLTSGAIEALDTFWAVRPWESSNRGFRERIRLLYLRKSRR